MDDQSKTVPDMTVALPRFGAGQMLRHFRLEAPLGEGGMGVIYRAHDTRLHRPVAVKFLSPGLVSDPVLKQRFLQEARAAARINHPAIAQIFDADEEAGVTFIVMELVEGKTVRQMVHDRELDLLGAMDIAIAVADGLAKAHELGIVHRDIKPANVMLTRDGHVKILDFGLAKLVGAAAGPAPPKPGQPDSGPFATTQPGIVMGTPAYMSPEQVRGLPVDARTDIFALGVLLFEMATGRSPFQRDNFMDALQAAAFEETPPMNSIRLNIPEDLQRVVSRCLRKRPEDRYSSARLVAEDLRRVRRDTEAGVTRDVPWGRRVTDLWEEVRQMGPSQYIWYALGVSAVVAAVYFSVSKIGMLGLVLLTVVGVFIYRKLRNQLSLCQEWFVRRASAVPEVRLIACKDRQVIVVVDRSVPQLYLRLNDHLRKCNRRLYFGEPMTLSILHELPAEEVRTMLAGPGVQYVREESVEKR